MKQSFGQRMKALRCQYGLRQSDVGLCLGIKESRVGNFETGKRMPKLSEICALVVSLRTPFEELFNTELELAKADVHARIADFEPPKATNHRDAKRGASFRALRASLDAPHGAHF